MLLRSRAFQHLLVLVVAPACSRSRPATGLNQDAAEGADLAPDMSSDSATTVVVSPAQYDASRAEAVSAIQDAAATDLTLPCNDIYSGTYDSGTWPFPLDWQTAQSASAWCGMFPNEPSTGLSLCQTSDGYNEAEITYVIGGEMMLVDRVFFLYDPAFGLFVEELYARTPSPSSNAGSELLAGPRIQRLNHTDAVNWVEYHFNRCARLCGLMEDRWSDSPTGNAVEQAVDCRSAADGRTGSVLRDEDSRTDSNLWESRKHLRIEGHKREVLPYGKFHKQGVVDRGPGLNRSFKSTVPQCLAWDGLNPQLGCEAESLPTFLGRDDLCPYSHPNNVGQFRFPDRRCNGTINSVPEATCLIDERPRVQEEIREDVRINDRSHSRPAEIHPSTSVAVGLRVCFPHAAWIWSRTETRSPTCSLMSSRTSCSIERRFFRARVFSDFATLSGTFRIVRVAMASPASTMLASGEPSNKPLKPCQRAQARTQAPACPEHSAGLSRASPHCAGQHAVAALTSQAEPRPSLPET